jgi:hypothetical protein
MLSVADVTLITGAVPSCFFCNVLFVGVGVGK